MDGDPQQVLDLARNWRDLSLPEDERAMMMYVETIAVRPSAATANDVTELRRLGFSDEEIFEIVMVTAYYALRCRMADGLGVELDERARQDPSLVEAFAYRNTADSV